MIPKNLIVFGTEITIKLVDLSEAHLYGLYEPTKKTILIHKDLDKNVMISTLIHEIGHAIFDIMSINQTSVEMNVQEIIVESYAKWFCENFDFKF